MSGLAKPSNLTLLGLQAIDVRRRKILKKAERMVAMAQGASLIDEDSPRPPGWSDEEYRVAMDARRPARNAPYYLGMNQRIKENAEKHEAMQSVDAPKTLNIGTINIVAPRSYKVIDVDPVTKG